MLKVTIDGKTTEVKEGTTVLNAARKLGIDIPTLCDHPQLTPYGGCRMCLVEVEGARTLQPSCTLPVNDNMVVLTDTEKVRKARKFVLTMIFSERNHFCPYCQVSGGDCELQNSAYDEGMTHWPIQPNWQPYPVDASHPFIILEHNRCILCRRCVRACGELVGNFTLGFEERGANSTLVADLGLPLGESSCIGCGTCVQVCPTGALIDRWSAYQGKETEVETTETICLGCSLGCGINVLTRDNRLVRIEGNWEDLISGGVICEVGRFHPMTEDRERLLTPLVKKDGKMKATTWEEAIQVSINLLSDKKKDFTAVASTRLSLEALNLFKIICDEAGINESSTTEMFSSLNSSYQLAKDKNGYETQLSALEAADCYIVAGEDITKDHQVLSFFIKRSIGNGSKLIQITNQASGFDNFANFTLLVQKSDQTASFIKDFAELCTSENGDIQKVADTYNMNANDLKAAVDLVVASERTSCVLGSRSLEVSDGMVKAFVDLANSLDADFLSSKGNINSMGAYQFDVENNVNRKNKKAAFLAIGDEDLPQSFTNQFSDLNDLIVLSSYVSPLTANAAVIFPTMNWLEQAGHFINVDGQLLEAKAALEAPENVKSIETALSEISESLGIKNIPDWKLAVSKRPAPVSISSKQE